MHDIKWTFSNNINPLDTNTEIVEDTGRSKLFSVSKVQTLLSKNTKYILYYSNIDRLTLNRLIRIKNITGTKFYSICIDSLIHTPTTS